MTGLILVCSCHKQDTKALDAFAVLFPGRPKPQVLKGRDKIFKYGQEIKNEHITAIGKLSGRFSYYVELENGEITLEYDLTHGKRII